MDKYINCVHGTTKTTPFEMSFCAASRAVPHTTIHNPILDDKIKLPEFPKFQVGDLVRVPDKRSVYSKCYETNWSRELSEIHRIISTNPVTYTLEDENKETIQGKYYEQELLRSAFNFEFNNKLLESMNIFHKFE